MENENKEELIEVDVPTMQTGTVKFMTKSGFSNPAPDKLKRVLSALKYAFVGIITAVAGTDLFTGAQSKLISFSLGVAIYILGAIELGTGVKPLDEEKKP